MAKIDEITRQQRLERIYLLLLRNARGLTESLPAWGVWIPLCRGKNV